MRVKTKRSNLDCPATREAARAAAQKAFDDLVLFCETCPSPFARFETRLFLFMAILGRCVIQLFLIVRHEGLDCRLHLQEGTYRLGKGQSKRTLKTAYGPVAFFRQYLLSCAGGKGFAPLDVALGLTRDKLSPWVRQWVARLATRMSYQATRLLCKGMMGWAPSGETIERVVLGMGRQAAPFMKQLAAPPEDGEVLVIEVDGKCAPTARASELAKRRGKRKPKHERSCECGCQRHRGKAKRRARGSKKRLKKGDKSKHGKEVSIVVMYTLKHGKDGRLHGPINKKLYATFAGRMASALWARAEATKRGFGPDTEKTVQIVLDGAKGLKANMKSQFPKAIFTLDVCHVVERLWALGHRFHKEGSAALEEWVEELKELVYGGRAEELVRRLKKLLGEIPKNGPGAKGRREGLGKLIRFVEPRLEMMQYGKWSEQDLAIASGQAEGAARYLVGERFDCSGMRWIPGKAEALLHLRCVELNGDWQQFVDWFERKTQARLKKGDRRNILTDQPLPIKRAA